MKRLPLVIAAIIVLAIAVTLLQPASDRTYVVNVANIPILPSKLPLEIALRNGYFDQEGVKVKATQISSSNLLADGLVRGDVDITPEISVLPFLNAETIDPGKVKIFSVMDLTVESKFDSIIVKKDSAIQSLADLAGKKIGVFSGTTATNMLKLLLKTQGIDSTGIQFIQLQPGDQLPALAAGSIDALHAYEPSVAIAMSDGTMRSIYDSVYAHQVNHSPLGAGLIRTAFIAEHPEEAAKVTRALNKAYDFMKTHEKETRAIMAEVFSFQPIVAEAVNMSYYKHGADMDKEAVETLVNLFVSVGEIQKKPNLANAYYVAP